MNLLASQQQQVQIERPRAIADGTGAIPSERQFDPEQGIEQFARCEGGLESDHGVYEARLIREPDRPGGVKGGSACHNSEAGKLLDGRHQRSFRRSCRTGDIRPHSDVRELHDSSLDGLAPADHGWTRT